MAGVNKEIWIDRLEKMNWYENRQFMAHGVDWNSLVEYDVINWAQSGNPPGVTKNPVYPLIPDYTGYQQRVDLPESAVLDNYASDPTAVTDVEELETNYAKMDSVLEQHKEVLEDYVADDILYAISPLADTPATPVFAATGGASPVDAGDIVTKTDIVTLAQRFDVLKYPKVGRVLVMPSGAFWSLVDQDANLNNQYAMNGREGVISGRVVELYGFQIITDENLPFYDAAFNKLAQGAVPVAGTDKQICLAYIKNKSWGRAKGTLSMYYQEDNPAWQGDLVSFRHRAVGKPLAQHILGGIVR